MVLISFDKYEPCLSTADIRKPAPDKVVSVRAKQVWFQLGNTAS